MSEPTLNLNYNNIYLGDSFELCEQVEAQTVDLILEDMPYNTTACDWDVKIDLELYWKTRLRILKPTGVVILTASQPFTTDLISSNKELFRYEWIWEKTKGSNFQLANKMPLKIHENILVYYYKLPKYNQVNAVKSYAKTFRNIENVKMAHLQKKDKHHIRELENLNKSVIHFGSVHNPGIHPTQKPVGLFEYLIRTYTNENDLVFDGFGGSGTTAIAASKCNRNFIVIEKEEKYYDLAKKRLKNELAQFKLFEGLK